MQYCNKCYNICIQNGGVIMVNNATVYARIDPQLKSDVDVILKKLGVTPSQLIQMLYSQIKLTNKIPFEISIPNRPKCFEELTEDEICELIEKSQEDFKNGRFYTAEQIEEMIKKKYKLK